MAHNLATTREGLARMAYSKVVPWHGLGVQADGLMTAEEVLHKAQLDVQVESSPIYRKTMLDGAEKYVRVSGYFGTAYEGEEETFGIVSSKYQVLQNRDAFSFFDAVVKNGEAAYETAGALGGGKVWILAKLPETVHLAGDSLIEQYLLLLNTHDGKSAVRAFLTPVRVVCQNTLNVACHNNTCGIRVTHNGQLMANLAEATRVMGLAREQIVASKSVYESLLTRKMDGQLYQTYINSIFGREIEATEITPRQKASDSRRDNRLLSAFDRENSYGLATSGTVWTGYNAVVDYVDHYEGRQRGMESTLCGALAGKKQQALESALALIN